MAGVMDIFWNHTLQVKVFQKKNLQNIAVHTHKSLIAMCCLIPDNLY